LRDLRSLSVHGAEDVTAYVGLVTTGVEGIANLPWPYNFVGLGVVVTLVGIVAAVVSLATGRVYSVHTHRV